MPPVAAPAARPGRALALAALAAALGAGSPARAAPPAGALAPRSSGQDPGDMSSETAGQDAAAELAAAAERRRGAGDLDGAIALWRRAFAALPATLGYAQRRAAVALAIAEAEEAAFRRQGEAARLRAAIEALDAYLAGLDPTDDENRAAVERRRAELVDLSSRTSRPEGPAPGPAAPPPRGGPGRPAALAAAGLAGIGLAAGLVAVAGAVAGRRADRALAGAVARPCAGDDPDDPCGSDAAREAIKADALADGSRANRVAIAGAAIGGALLVAGAAVLIAGTARSRARARAAWSVRGPVLVLRSSGLALRF